MKNNNIVVVGITGLMGSGKSYISKIFSTHGAIIYDTDTVVEAICIKNKELRNKLIDKFGKSYYDGIRINKPYVKSLYFGDDDQSFENLTWANENIKPYLIEHFLDYKRKLEDNNTINYILFESAILFESGLNTLCDKIIGVRAPNSCSAAIYRDNITRDDWLRRMQSQLFDSEKTFDYIINNDYTDSLNNQVFSIHNKIINGN